MPTREFKDGRGRQWRAWDVKPDDLNPRTKDEDYLAQLYYTGWMHFESKSGDDKRRLYPIPNGWQELPDAELEVLLQKAEIVRPRRSFSWVPNERGRTGTALSRESCGQQTPWSTSCILRLSLFEAGGQR